MEEKAGWIMGEAVTLGRDAIALCQEIGRKRLTHALAHHPPGNSHGLDERTRLRNEVYGCYGECAAAQAMGVPWEHQFYENTTGIGRVRDLLGFIQVKTKRKRRHKLLLPKPQGLHSDAAYLSVCIERFPACDMCGWVWGGEITDADITEPNPGYPAWTIVPADERMKQFRDLMAEAVRRGKIVKPHMCPCGAYGTRSNDGVNFNCHHCDQEGVT